MAQTHDIEWYLAQVRRIAEHREKGAEKEIRKLYKEMLKDLQSFIGTQYALLAEDDQLTYGILQAKGEAARFLEEVEANINSVSPKVQRQIRDVVEQTYAAAYTGMVDAVEKAHNLEELRINLDGIRGTTPETVKKAVENPVSGLTLSDTLEKHRKEVIYEIKRQIGVGLIAGDRYSTMARRISDQLDMDYRKSIRIVRTETNRVREAGAQEGAIAVQEKLKNANSEYRMTKTWHTMKDERVRPQRKAYKRKPGVKARKQYTAGWRSSLNGPNHVKMEGKTVLIDEQFDLGGGVKTMAPCLSGVAGHDINCRCYTSEKLMNDEEFFKATGKHFPDFVSQMSRPHTYTGNTWPKTGEKISKESLDELTNFAKEYGISIKSFDNFDGDVSAVKDIIKGIADVDKDFNGILGINKRIILHNSFNLNDDDFAETIGHNIYINNFAFRNKAILAQEYAKKAEEGWFVPGTDYRSIAYHEMGHVLINSGKVKTRNAIQNAFHKTTSSDIDEILKKELSEYATVSVKEMIAESVSAYYSLENPPAIALTILRACDIL